jgi:hypothetical protein
LPERFNCSANGPDKPVSAYEHSGTRLHTYNRVVIPVTPAPRFQRYLVQFTVTTLADQAVPESGDVEAIIRGFAVSVK